MSEEIEKTVHAAGETVVKATKGTAMVIEKTGPVVTEISNHALGAGRITIRAFGRLLSVFFPK